MGGWKKKGDGKKEEEIIRDPRFAGVHRDPRFQKAGKHKTKVKIDARFSRMFTDKSFASSSAAPFDKRGKSFKNKDSAAAADTLKRYYHHLDDDDDSDGNQEDEEKINSTVAAAAAAIQTSDASTDDDDDDDDDDDESSDHNQDDDNNISFIQKETHRLAVVNMDWNQVKAVDLYVLFNSFLPKGGQILSVTVYPTDFGLTRMEEETARGPVGLFDKDDQNESEDDGDEIDVEKLRAYELSRLKYYHGVVECDSIATADYLYSTCDGLEFERSSNKLDLRFIPDEMEFKNAPRDVASEAPGSYEGIDFQTRALQQSKINLTWDEDEPQRSRTLKRKFNADQLAELELKEFMASDESETDEGENLDNDVEHLFDRRHKKLDKYRALMLSGDGSDRDEENEDQDMEVTFNTGLEDISKRILEKKDKKSETVWEAYLRNKKEKRKARKNKSKDASDDEGSETDREPTEEPDDFFVEDTHVKNGKGEGIIAEKRKETQETAKKAQASVAELELLFADVNAETNLKGYNLKPKKAKGKKGKKEVIDEEKIPSVDPTNDPRFSSLLTSHLFALDPTDPEFRRSATYARQVAQKQRKGERELVGNEHSSLCKEAHLSSDVLEEVGKDEQILCDGLSTKKDKHGLSSLVKSIKMKSKQLQESNYHKVSGKGKNKLTKKSGFL